MTAARGRRGRSPTDLSGARGDAGDGLRPRLLRRFAASRFYRHSLIGPIPADFAPGLAQRWTADAERGAAIAAGEIELAGETVRHPEPRWFPPAASPEWLAAWHGFGWLADLAAGGAAARETGRVLVRSWLADNSFWHPLGWRADVLATRLFAWLAYADEIAGRDQEPALRRAMLASFAAQLRHLGRTAGWECTGAARLRALKGLASGIVAVGGSEARLGRALRLLDREIAAQILPDGGHRSRNPSLQLQILQDLIDIRAVLRAGGATIPPGLQDAVERMAPMLRLFRHGDRRLALFNDSLEEDGILIDLVLTRSEAKGRAPLHAPATGFDRLQAAESLVILDTGGPPSHGFDRRAHAGTLSFEMSHGRERLIVNCGAYRGPKPSWGRVSRASAAHSVLVVADTNSVVIGEDGATDRGPGPISCERAEQDGQQWISASHDHYRQRYGLTYTRQIFLAAGGEDLRGEDQLAGRPGAAFTVRFHLHPAVEASLAEDAAAALLRLPSGALWRLRAAGAEMSIGESVYLGSGEARKTQQVVLNGTVAPGGTAVRWALRREAKENAAD